MHIIKVYGDIDICLFSLSFFLSFCQFRVLKKKIGKLLPDKVLIDGTVSSPMA